MIALRKRMIAVVHEIAWPQRAGSRSAIILAIALCLAPSNAVKALAEDYLAIQQIFQQHCVECHGPHKREGGLRLDRAPWILRGGDSGPAISRQKSGDSELYRRITSQDADRMPPEGPALTPEDIAGIAAWIDSDLPGLPADEPILDDDVRLKHWAWQPIQRPEIPEIDIQLKAQSSAVPRNAIDHFVIAKLKEQGLEPAPTAPLVERLRRLSYDLRGLPLDPDEWKDLNTEEIGVDTYTRAVERFLTDPAYGEKWARHWLDIAHYADTHGFERDQRRPNAWRYRDYVIDSWNRDLAYDQFISQQIAGDILAPRDPASVTATGFLAAGPYDFVGQEETQSEVLRRQARADDLDDMLTQIMTSLCGVTIHCARCHDHKLDPISQTEYYEMTSLLAAVRRTDRPIDDLKQKAYEETQANLTQRIAMLRSESKKLRQQGLDLADLIGGGNGFGTGQHGAGIDPASGKVQLEKRGYLENIGLNKFHTTPLLGVDGVAIPDGIIDGQAQRLVVSSTGIEIPLPDTSGACWDAVRHGPVHSLYSAQLGGVDYGTDHSMLGTHANVAVSFDLDALRNATQKEFSSFHSGVGYFGQTAEAGASVAVFLDGTQVAAQERIGRSDGLKLIHIPIRNTQRFLTLLITDAGNGISHDQVGLIDPTLTFVRDVSNNDSQAAKEEALKQIDREIENTQAALAQLRFPERYYGIQSTRETPIFRLRRGNPEDPLEPVQPNAIGCVPITLSLPNASTTNTSTTDAERRSAFASWLTDPSHPLVARVIVNRLWHYHFGRGIVDTPSDFGLGGNSPSHPELLDWLASELIEHNGSLKHIQRLICTSHTYQQSSKRQSTAIAQDSENRWLWRRSPKRLDAEALRDSVLALSDCLDRKFYGPGYEDFEYQEEYAPVYRYIPANAPALWRRSIYRYIVRTTTHQFLATLDCPNAANLTPVRDQTTTPLQALALMNNDFMRDQAQRFADRLQNECGDSAPAKVTRAFELAFARTPSPRERSAAVELIEQTSVATFCLMLFNANEFIFVD